MIRLYAAALLLVVGAHCATADAKRSKMSDLRAAFESPDAAARLGHPGGKIESVSEFLPSVAWVIIDAPDGGEGRPVVVENGRFDPARDARTAARALKRIGDSSGKLDASAVAVLLEKFSALPPGFSSSQIDVTDPTTGARGGLTQKPFKLVLVSSNWTAPSTTAHDEPGPPGPPRPPGPPGQPLSHPTEAVSPPHPARATLSAADGHFAWSVESWDGSKWNRALHQPLD